MKQETAIQHLNVFVKALQRFRTMCREETEKRNILPKDKMDYYLSEMFPWIFGDKCPLLALTKTLDLVMEGHDLEPMVYYNYMTILHRFMPEILITTTMYEELDLGNYPPDMMVVAEGWE